MSARERILEAVRRHCPPEAPLPDLVGPWIEYDDPPRQFVEVLNKIGGRGLIVPTWASAVEDWQQYRHQLEPEASGWVCSYVPQLATSSPEVERVTQPHELARVTWGIFAGEWAVAENAAVWVRELPAPYRAAYFLCEHLVLVVAVRRVVSNLHQAYERLRDAGQGFGCFISGPSKTADIEQCLVIGAHGPRSLTVYLIEQAD
ncbi:MAG: hypothetical protein KatS3mg114_1021 [Planctomycetaceae bacterium]|nr:MAG: hypothetical protein KatS3mg114_1021 [Planctomycetaceae bacterium]